MEAVGASNISAFLTSAKLHTVTFLHMQQGSPFIAPLDKDMVKLILRLLRSATFQGTAQLLTAIANTDNEMHAPEGLLKVIYGFDQPDKVLATAAQSTSN